MNILWVGIIESMQIDEYISSPLPFLLLFERHLTPDAYKMIDDLKTALSHFNGQIQAGLCMIDKSPELAELYDVKGVPTIITGLHKRVIGRCMGMKTADELQQLIRHWLTNANKDEDINRN